MLGGIWSTVWRGFCGSILCYLVAGITSTAVGLMALLFRDDFAYLKEAGSGFVGGIIGAEAGVWVLNHTLKRYPGRTIAWIYIGIVTPLLGLIVVGSVWLLIDPKAGPPLADYLDKRTIFQCFGSIGEAIAFYFSLIRPKTNFMDGIG